MEAEKKRLKFQVGLEQSEFRNVDLLTPRRDIAIIRDNTTASDEIDSQH